MRFSRGFINKCLLADQTVPQAPGGVKLMLGARGEKEQKREVITLPVHRHFLLLFHPLEAQEARPQTIWHLEMLCESWGSARARQHPWGPGAPLSHPLSPAFCGMVSFTHFLIALLLASVPPGLRHLCCITMRKAIPTLRRKNVCRLSTSLRARKPTVQPGTVCYREAGWGHPGKGHPEAFVSRFERADLLLKRAVVMVSLLRCAVSH